jgi:hypothetical protein
MKLFVSMSQMARRSGRPALLLGLLALVAACAQTRPPATATVHRPSGYHRPASYDPPGPPGDPWGPWVREAAANFDVPERWIREVMRQESAGRSTATSRVGAMGLMQVMPSTYAGLAQRYGFGDDPYHPYDNIMAGAAYIREMYDLYGSPAFLAAYNAGPRRLEDYLWGNRGLPNETRNYVARIGPNVIAHHPTRRAPPEVYAAGEIPTNIPAGPRRMDAATMLALREQREAAQTTQLAEARTNTLLAPLPSGVVVRMEPIPDGATYAQPLPPQQPVQLAAAGPGIVVRMDPIPDGTTPGGAEALAEAAAREAANNPPPPLAGGYRYASLPLPPVPAPAPAAAGRHGAAQPPALLHNAAARGLPAPRGFGLLGSAHAASLPATRPAPLGTGNWAVQVGAFASQNLAQTAAAQARDAAATLGSRAVVQPVGQGHARLYRARVMGLSQGAATAACQRMRGRGACTVLSPDGQS